MSTPDPHKHPLPRDPMEEPKRETDTRDNQLATAPSRQQVNRMPSLTRLGEFLHPRPMPAESTRSPITDVEIFYGTMFGSAERYARLLAYSMSSQSCVRVVVHDLDTFDEQSFTAQQKHVPSRLFVFVVSTHFAGAPSPSAERFRNWILQQINGDGQRPQSRTQTKGHWHDFFSTRTLLWRLRSPLHGLQFTVFGIGDSIYLTYNAMGKFVDGKLKQLGASRFHPLGLGDCSKGLDRSFRAWEGSLLLKLPPPTPGKSSIRLSVATPVTVVAASRKFVKKSLSASRLVFPTVDRSLPQERYDPRDALNVPDDASFSSKSRDLSRFIVHDHYDRVVNLRFCCRTLSSEQVNSVHLHGLSSSPSSTTSVHALGPRTPRAALFDDVPFADLSVVHRQGFSIAHQKTPRSHRDNGAHAAFPRSATFAVRLLHQDSMYVTVSTLAVFPQNSPEEVDAVAEAFGYDLDSVFELQDRHNAGTQLPFPTPCTVRTALTEFIELRTISREVLRVASGYVQTLEERELLENLASTDGSTAFTTQIQDQHKGVLDLLAIAPTLKIPFEVFANITSTIRPRYFTIASSPKVSPRDLEIAVLLGHPNEPHGLAVSFFERIANTSSGAGNVPLRGFISSSRFQFLDDGVSPLILIASGVGFGAMRAIITERLASIHSDDSPRRQSVSTVRNHILFLGTTNEESAVFQDDLRRWEQQLVVKVYYAYSNDRRHPRRYVQDVVSTRMDEIIQAVTSSNHSRIFVCGRAAMVRRIRELFEGDQMRRGSDWFDRVHKSGRFIDEGYN